MRERTVATYVVAAASVIFYAVIHGDVSAWWLATIPVMWFIGTLTRYEGGERGAVLTFTERR